MSNHTRRQIKVQLRRQAALLLRSRGFTHEETAIVFGTTRVAVTKLLLGADAAAERVREHFRMAQERRDAS